LIFFSFNTKLVVEVDGSQHYTEEGRCKDGMRDAYLRRQGLTILRFSDYDVLTNLDGVVETIWTYANEKL
jgi:very-short-patch-repair endonuclease